MNCLHFQMPILGIQNHTAFAHIFHAFKPLSAYGFNYSVNFPYEFETYLHVLNSTKICCRINGDILPVCLPATSLKYF